MGVRPRLTGFRMRNLPEWQQDAAIVASSVGFGLLFYLMGLYPLYETGGEAAGWLRPAIFGAMCTIELFRRRAPTTVLTIGSALLIADMFLGLTMPMWFVYADLLYAATLYGSQRLSRVMVPIAALGSVCLTMATLLSASDWQITILAGLGALAFIVIPVWWAANVRQYQEVAAAERTNAYQLARIGELDRKAAVTAERAQMARDLHDVISGHLSAIAIQSEAALSMSDTDLGPAHNVLVSVRQNSVRALEEMRTMVDLLRADGTEDVEETTAPARLAELSKLVESARASGLDIDMRSELDDSVSLPAAVDLTAYRIAQEALTNVVKHAPQTTARLEIRRTDGMLTVEVVNELADDPGDTTDTGTGLLNMHERAAAVGGWLIAGPSESGWSVRAALPVSEASS